MSTSSRGVYGRHANDLCADLDNNPHAPEARPRVRERHGRRLTMKAPFEAASWIALRIGLIVPVLALLSITVAANADRPASRIEIFDVDLAQPDAIGAPDHCWENAPMGARVVCAPPWPEHGELTVEITLEHASSSDVVIGYESMDLTATGGTDYVALDGTITIAAGDLLRDIPDPFHRRSGGGGKRGVRGQAQPACGSRDRG